MKRILILLVLVSTVSLAQRRMPLMKKNRSEIVVGVGATNFLGDLGGANGVGTHIFRDIEFSTTRPDISVGYRYFFTPVFSARAGIYYGLVSGNDNLTGQPDREYRNLSFKSNIWELSAQAEGAFLTIYREGHRYDIKRAKGYKNILFQGYAFVGAGAFHFNPKGYYRGKWYKLQELGTEGQGLPGEPEKYKRVGFCIPIGAGFRYGLNRRMTIGLEYGIRKTFTDYIDDVSGVYYDKETIREYNGDAAAYFADPSSGLLPSWTATGTDRGHPNYKDSYMFMFVTATYRLSGQHKRTNAKF